MESIRQQKINLLLEEAKYFVNDIDEDYELIKIVANELPLHMLMRIINKMRRLRGVNNLWWHPIKQ